MNDAVAQAIVIERVLPHPPETIWRALTQSDLIRRWLMPNDFEPRVGHQFVFVTKPVGDWDGVVHCEVLSCEPCRLLRYSWVGGAATNDSYGSRLDSVVTWTLTPVAGGTHVRMEHDGFGPGNAFAFDVMGRGWSHIFDVVAGVVNEIA